MLTCSDPVNRCCCKHTSHMIHRRDSPAPIFAAPILAKRNFYHEQAGKQRREIIDNDAKKERRRIAHSAPGTRKVKPARKRKIVAEQE